MRLCGVAMIYQAGGLSMVLLVIAGDAARRVLRLNDAAKER
jgi:hypothetical protein